MSYLFIKIAYVLLLPLKWVIVLWEWLSSSFHAFDIVLTFPFLLCIRMCSSGKTLGFGPFPPPWKALCTAPGWNE